MQYNRTKNTMLNLVSGILTKTFAILMAFIVRTIFINTLGIQYVGVSGVFTDILTVLSFAELGFGSAIVYALYKPIASKDKEKASQLMRFYKNIYRITAAAIFVIGLAITPFLNRIITNVPDIRESLRLIYLLYIINTSSSYLLIYKSSLLTASQKDYIVSSYKIVISIFKAIFECVLLLVFKNFILYLIFSICVNIIQNLLISRKADQLYPFLKDKHVEGLPAKEIKKIFNDVKALFLYKISGVVLNGTDSVIISSFLGTSWVGLLSNYNLIVNQLYSFIMQIFNATTASIGNLAATESKEHQYKVFKNLFFLCFWIYCFSTSCLWSLIDDFVLLWLGKDRTLSYTVITLLLFEFYIRGMLSPISSFRTSNGLFVQGKYRPLIMALINIIVSLFLVNKIGVSGVIIGTIFSRAVTQLWYDPYLIYKLVFEIPVRKYFFIYGLYTSITFICCVITSGVSDLVLFPNPYVQFLLRACVSALLPNLILLLLFSRTNEFKELSRVATNLLKKLKQRKGTS